MARHGRDAEAGAAAVEFALVLPILLLLVFGIVDFGRAYHSQVTLTHAAREGVRILALSDDGTTARQTITDRLSDTSTDPLAPGALGTVTMDAGSTTDCDAATDARLTLTETFTFITPLPGLAVVYGGTAWSDEVVLTGEAVMLCGG